MNSLPEILGWIGASLFVIAYFLISSKKVDSSNAYYHIINLVGAVLVGINVFYQEAWPVLALEVVWGTIALASLLKERKSKGKNTTVNI